MKPPMPVKATALIALAAGLSLPAAKAQTLTPVSSAATAGQAPVSSGAPSAAPTHSIGVRVSLDAVYNPTVAALYTLFNDSHKNYVVAPEVKGFVTLRLIDVPLDKALNILAGANSEPLEWSVQDGIYHIRPRAAVADVKAASAAPRQVQIKFEWVSSASALNAAPDKDLDVLTIVAEEGRKSQVSSQHLRNGTGGQETISVLPRLEPGGVVALDITERSDSTTHAGDTKSNASETTVRVKDGQTGVVRGQMSKQSGQNAERMLFVTPTIIRSTD